MLIPFQNDHADGALMHRSDSSRADVNPMSKSRGASRRQLVEPRDQVVDNNEDFPIDVSKTDSELSVGAEEAKGFDSPSSKKQLGPTVGLNVKVNDDPKFSLSSPSSTKSDSPSGLTALIPQFMRKPTEKTKTAKEFAFDNAMLPKQTVFTQEKYAVQSAENKISQFAFQNVMNASKPPSKHEKFLLQKEAVSAGITHVPIIGVSNPALFSDELSQKKGMLQMTKPAAPFHKPPPARDLVEIQRPISDGKSSKFETHQQVQNRLKSSMQMVSDTPKLGVKKYVEGSTPVPNAPIPSAPRKIKTSADLPASRPQAYLVPKKDFNSFSSAMSPVKELGSNPLFVHKHPPPAKLTL